MTLTCRGCGLVWHESEPRPVGHEVVYRFNAGVDPVPHLLLHNPV